MTPLALSDWKADHVRISLFSNDVWPGSAEGIYKTVFSSAPESIIQKPNAGESIATGTSGSLGFEVRHAFNRVDLFFKAHALDAPVFLPIENIENQIQSIASKAQTLYKDNKSIIRIAVGATGLFEVNNGSEAYEKVSELTGLNLNFSKHRDLHFQINIPQDCKVYPELKINQMTVWNCPAIGQFSPDLSMSNASIRKFFCGCMTDINTDGDRKTPIPEQHLDSIFKELTAAALSIYQNGIKL